MVIRHQSVAFTTGAFKQMQMKVISDAGAEHRSRLFQCTGAKPDLFKWKSKQSPVIKFVSSIL